MADEDPQLNDQAFLLDFFTDTVTKNINRKVTPPAPKMYNQFVQLTGDGAGLMNRLQVAGSENILFGLTTAQLAMLVPKISISKITKDSDGKTVAQPFLFDDYTSERSITRETGRNRGEDVGLTSFTWNDMGSNPGNSGLSFEAALKLKFQSFDGVFKVRDGNISFADLLIPAYVSDIAGGKRTLDSGDFQIKAVVGWNVPQDPNLVVFKNRQTIAAIASTQTALILTLTSHDIDIREDGSLDLTINYIASLEGRMMTPKMDLLKVFDSSHEKELLELRTQQDTAREKQTALAQTIARKKSEREATRTKVIADIKEHGSALVGTGRTGGTAKYISVEAFDADQARRFTQQARAAEEINVQRNYLKQNRLQVEQANKVHKLKTYQRLLNKIENPVSNHRRMFFIELSQTQIELYAAMNNKTHPPVEAKGQQQKAIAKRAQIVDHRQEVMKNIRKAAGVDKRLVIKQADFSERHNNLSKVVEKVISNETIKDKDNRETTADVIKEGVKEGGISNQHDWALNPVYYLNYFYFGDLIEAALEILKDDPATREIETDYKPAGGFFGFMLGQINLYNVEHDEVVSVPLADIPISLKLFQQWFLEAVIKKGVTTLPLLSFLRTVCSKLITGALNPKASGSPQKAANTQISLSQVVLRDNTFKGKVGYNPQTHSGRVNAESIKPRKLGESPEGWGSISLERLQQFYFLYVGGNLNDRLTGDKTADEKVGIFHIPLGADTGLIKKINFKRTDIPFQREARILNAKENEAANLGSSNLLYSDQYNATLTMVGNAIFKPGMLIYLNPIAMGIGAPALKRSSIAFSPASRLGLGGYYLVSRVENIVESGKFESLVEVIAQAPMYALNPVRTTVKTPANSTASKRANPVTPLEQSGAPRKKYNPTDERGKVETVSDAVESGWETWSNFVDPFDGRWG